MRHAIIFELRRLGFDYSRIKDELLKWNKRNERPLGISKQRSQLLGYVDWFEQKENEKGCRLGCDALEDYCLGKENCQFLKRTTYWKRQQTQKLPFDIMVLEKFLTERFKGDGFIMMLIVKALKFYQQEKATGEVMLIGLRGISSIIRDRYGHMIHYVDVSRKMGLLIDEGVIDKVVQGKSGMFRNEANGYRFLPWQPPQLANDPISSTELHQQKKYEDSNKDVETPIFTDMCNKVTGGKIHNNE
jgi:hypothetical protein